MAIIECPECHKEVSDKANACPNCGCPLVSKEDKSQEIINIANEKVDDAKKKRKVTFGIIIIFASLIIVGIIAFISIRSVSLKKAEDLATQQAATHQAATKQAEAISQYDA